MNELITASAFLLTSMYGAGNASSVAANVQTSIANMKDTTAPIATTTDRKAMEKYLKEQYADTPVLVEIARCESEFRQFDKNGLVIHGRAVPDDIGLMQKNEFYHGSTAKNMGMDIYTVEGNIAYAKYLYKKNGTKDWTASKPCWSNPTVAINK